MSGVRGISKNPFQVGMYLVALLVVVELIVFVLGMSSRSDAAKTMVQIQNRLAKVSSVTVSANAETLAQLNQVNAELNVSNKRLRNKLFLENESLFQDLPENTTAAYFDLADFVERMEVLLKDSNIGFESDERFGFVQFEQTGPALENVREVIFQKVAMEYVLGALADAAPNRLLQCRRHFVGKSEQENSGSVLRQAVRSSSDSSRFEDTFNKVNEVGFYDASELELSFEGYSKSLRTFMTRLLALPVPVVVESLQVNPSELSQDAFASEDLEDGSRLVITNSPSTFTIRLTVLFDGREPKS